MKLIAAVVKMSQELLDIVLHMTRIRVGQVRLSSSKFKRNKRKYFVMQNTAEICLLLDAADAEDLHVLKKKFDKFMEEKTYHVQEHYIWLKMARVPQAEEMAWESTIIGSLCSAFICFSYIPCQFVLETQDLLSSTAKVLWC